MMCHSILEIKLRRVSDDSHQIGSQWQGLAYRVAILPSRSCPSARSHRADPTFVCNRHGRNALWRESFEKDTLPAIREAIQKGDAFTNLTYLEAPLPVQDVDFV